MSYDDKVSQIIKNHKLKHRLQEIGIYPNMGVKKIVGPTGPKGDIGPTGPQGNGLQIMGSYSSEEELLQHHPTGNIGESYIISGDLYVWNDEDKKWENVGNVQGPTGIAEKIKINTTTTTENGGKAEVIDTFENDTHVLDFVIPKGDVGKLGLLDHKVLKVILDLRDLRGFKALQDQHKKSYQQVIMLYYLLAMPKLTILG